jgi:hypothetical protein
MNLRMFLDPTIDLPPLTRYLDELGHAGRLYATRQWDKATQARLYEAAKGYRATSIDDVVPRSTEALREVIHHGKNSLPVFSTFQKRFCRPSDPTVTDKLWGYNHQAMTPVTGPGYFVTRPGTNEGEVDIDYTMLPPEKCAGWPAIIPNSAKLGRFIYEGMVDTIRGISQHVTIGRATIKGKVQDAYFVLVREDPNA